MKRPLLHSLATALILLGACSSEATPRGARAAQPDGSRAVDGSRQVDTGLAVDLPGCTQPTPSVGCEAGMCLVRAGCFVMGAPRDEVYAAQEADVQVEVRLTQDFWIGQTEVTLAQWRRAGFDDPIPDWTRTGSTDPAKPPPGYSVCKDPTCPVVWVNYEDAMAFANARSEKEGLPPCYTLGDCTGSPGKSLRCKSVKINAASPLACRGYRLPNEAEWEYAARAGTRTAFHSGDMDPNVDVSLTCKPDGHLDAIGWYCGNAGAHPGMEAGGGQAHPVAQKLPNAWGLHDVSGNAREWVNDIFDPRGYGAGPFVDPTFGLKDPSNLTPDTHPTFGSENKDAAGYPDWRGQRGGSFDLWSYDAKSSWRAGEGAAAQYSGFRLVRTVPPRAASEK